MLKIVELSPSNVLLKIELENNDEINISQITKKKYTSVANFEAVCNEGKKVIFKGFNSYNIYL